MKKVRNLIAVVMALVLGMCLFAGTSVSGSAAGSENIYYIEPVLGDGASISQSELNELYVRGILYKNGYFTFTQTRVLTFTVRFESGWTYNSDYSSVFAGDSGSLVIKEGKDYVTFKYTATSGKSIKFSSLQNVCVFTTADQLPRLYLNVEGSFENVDKTEWVDCSIRLDLGTKKYTSGNYVGTGQVKGRGQASWQKDQKPYSINLNEKASLLDIPANKKYAIVTTISDDALVRNLVMFSAAQNLEGIDYVVKAEPVEVYLNNSYNGIYTLCERVKISGTKVDETEASADYVDGAYILEKTVTGKLSPGDIYFEAPYLGHPNATGQKDIVAFKDPDSDITDAMIEYCRTAFFNAHDAIMSDSDTAYKQFIDADSWIDFIIMQEVSKNVDGDLKTSSFMLLSEHSQVLQFTSLWDFDLAFGNADYDNNASGSGVRITDTPNAATATKFMTINSACPWFLSLYGKDSFKQALMEQYTKYRSTVIADMQNRIGYYAAYMQKSVAAQEKWKKAGEVKTAVNTLKSWLEKRLLWLDSQWLLDPTEVAPHKITVTTSGSGTVTASDGVSKVANGSYKIYTIVPESGSVISSVRMNGRDVTDEVTLGVYNTPYVTKDSTLEVVFRKSGSEQTQPASPAFSVFIDAQIQNGTVSVSADSAPEGDTVTVTATANDGFILDKITVDNTELSSDTFVMPQRNVVVSAVFRPLVLTQQNREALTATVALVDTASMKAISNLSAVEISDTYTNLIAQADNILNDEAALPDQINYASIELLRMFGVMNRKEIKDKQLSALADAVELTGTAADSVSGARTAAESGDAAAVTSAWDALIDAYYTVPANTLLESLCISYSGLDAKDYTKDSYAAFSEALTQGRAVLENTAASQSAIDTAAANLSYTGRNLVKKLSGDTGIEDKPQNGSGTLKNVIMIIAVVLAAAAVLLVAVVLIKVISRRMRAR